MWGGFAEVSTSGVSMSGFDTANGRTALTYSANLIDNNWHHVLITVDKVNSYNATMYVDGISRATTSWASYTWVLAPACPYISIGTGWGDFVGSLALFYLHYNYSAGVTPATFRNADGSAVDIGNGTSVFGQQPLIYLRGSGASFNVNDGSMGNFSNGGVVTIDTTSFNFGVGTSVPIKFYNADTTAFGTTLTSILGSRIPIIAKYNSSGTVQWVAKLDSNSLDTAQSVCNTLDGGLAVCGNYIGTLTAYNGNGTAFGTTVTCATNASFLVKYNTSGTVQWMTTLGVFGNNSTSVSAYNTIDGGIIIGGFYAGTGTALTIYNANGTAFGTTLPSNASGYNNCFLAKYSSSGMVQWVTRLAGSTGSDYIYGICGSMDGNVFAVGKYDTNALTSYNANGTAYGTTLAVIGGTDIFLTKYSM
jgi:hypothetical protein